MEPSSACLSLILLMSLDWSVRMTSHTRTETRPRRLQTAAVRNSARPYPSTDELSDDPSLTKCFPGGLQGEGPEAGGRGGEPERQQQEAQGS